MLTWVLPLWVIYLWMRITLQPTSLQITLMTVSLTYKSWKVEDFAASALSSSLISLALNAPILTSARFFPAPQVIAIFIIFALALTQNMQGRTSSGGVWMWIEMIIVWNIALKSWLIWWCLIMLRIRSKVSLGVHFTNNNYWLFFI